MAKNLFQRIAAMAILSFLMLPLSAQTTYKFVDRNDTLSLFLDHYKPAAEDNGCCVVFVFGGGFIKGARDSKNNAMFAKLLAEKGYTVACIDYRLGLKNKKLNAVNIVKALDTAIAMATEDLVDATAFLIQNTEKFGIDTSKIILCGSSAGAITVLQADFELANRAAVTRKLPADFHYAGVISFSGAIYSHNGLVKYKNAPAPTLLLHGIDDRLVPYKFIRIGNLGFFGSNSLAKRFEKYQLPYCIRRYVGLGHEVAGIFLQEVELCDNFIHQFVIDKKKDRIDVTIFDSGIKQTKWHNARASDFY